MATRPKYVLQDLLLVRCLREDTAAKEWSQQKAAVADVESELDRRRRELTDYRAWRVGREAQIFDEILRHTVLPKDVERVRARIQKLRDNESNHQSRVIETERCLRTEQQKLEDDRRRYFAAYRDRDKLDEHKANWLRAADRETEAAQEREVEDFKNRMGGLAAEGV